MGDRRELRGTLMDNQDFEDEIVTDDCSVGVHRHHGQQFNMQPPHTYKRNDSGFNSGDMFLQNLDQYPVQPETKTIQYLREDSGFCSQLNSLSINSESSNIKSGESQILVTKSPEPSRNDFLDVEELFEQDPEGDTQLHLAIASNYEDVVNALVRLAPKPEYLNIQNNELYAPLHIAVLTNQPNIVRKLVVAGATTQIIDQEGNTPLHHACGRGLLECAQNLLKPISIDEVQDSALRLEQNYLHQVLDQTNHKGEHCLHLATFGKHYDIIRFLLWKGANMNVTEGRSGKTALHYAVNMRDNELVEFLAGEQCQVDLDCKDWSGRTPIQCAMINGDDYIRAVLESLGADTTPIMEYDDSEEQDEEFEMSYSYSDLDSRSRILEGQA